MNQHSKSRKKRYQPRSIPLPMTSGLHNRIALHMHASLAVLERTPDVDSFDSLANILNMVGLTIARDPSYVSQFRMICGATRAMNDMSRLVKASVPLSAHHLAPIQVAVAAIDEILGGVNVATLYVAEKVAVRALRNGVMEIGELSASAPLHI